jgi:hypothetical protein
MMDLHGIRDVTEKFVKDNATTLLTAGGVVGTVGTAILSWRSGFRSAEKLQEEMQVARRQIITEEDRDPAIVELPLSTKIRTVWPEILPPLASGSITVFSIVFANRMSAQKAAALAAAYGLTQDRLKEYQDKVATKLTGPKQQAIVDEVAQDRVRGNPPDAQVLILSGNDVLCYDQYTGRYFQSSVEKIRRAENEVNADLFHHQYASASSFYDKVGLAPTTLTDMFGWNQGTTGPMELRFSTVMATDEKPCIAIDFVVPPQPDYNQLY